jgi:hypothetical protein
MSKQPCSGIDDCCTKHRDHFRDYIDMWCLGFDDTKIYKPYIWVAIGAVIAFNLTLNYRLFRLSTKKIERTTKARDGEQDTATYCVFSLYQLYGARIVLGLLLVRQMFNIIAISFGNSYALHTVGPESFSCEPPAIRGMQFLTFHFVDSVLILLLRSASMTIFILNIYEFIAMWYIIWSQDKRDVNQILYDFNTENMQDWDQNQLSYRKNEIRIQRAMVVVCVVLVVLFAAINV